MDGPLPMRTGSLRFPTRCSAERLGPFAKSDALGSAGKTLSAILASRLIDSHVTLIVTNNATVKGWREQILNAYPDSVVPENVDDHLQLDRSRYNYIILNYE